MEETSKLKLLWIDGAGYKTTAALIEHFKNHPDIEFQIDAYADPAKMAWADVIYVEWCETNAILASLRRYDDSNHRHWNDAENRFGAGNIADWSKARLIIRGIDIDCYYGHFRGVRWDQVDTFLFIAKHIKDYVFRDAHLFPDTLRVRVVPLGVDIENLTYRDRSAAPRRRVAILHHNWSGKNLPLLAQAIAKLVERTGRDWDFHLVGTWSNELWLKEYFWHICEELKIRELIRYDDRVEDVNAWLEDYDYLISASAKEAFSLVVAEAAAKGIKPLIHNFLGAKDIWPDEFVWTTVDEFAKKMQEPHDSPRYREIVKKYDMKNQIKAIEEEIYGKGGPVS